MRKVKKIPEFKNYAEEAKFWDTHDFSDFWEETEPVEIEFLGETKREDTITIRVQPRLKERLEQLARSYGINLSSLARMWLIEKLRQAGKNV
jgi:predicted DNA binding CopG/RHH family protein